MAQTLHVVPDHGDLVAGVLRDGQGFFHHGQTFRESLIHRRVVEGAGALALAAVGIAELGPAPFEEHVKHVAAHGHAGLKRRAHGDGLFGEAGDMVESGIVFDDEEFPVPGEGGGDAAGKIVSAREPRHGGVGRRGGKEVDVRRRENFVQQHGGAFRRMVAQGVAVVGSAEPAGEELLGGLRHEKEQVGVGVGVTGVEVKLLRVGDGTAEEAVFAPALLRGGHLCGFDRDLRVFPRLAQCVVGLVFLLQPDPEGRRHGLAQVGGMIHAVGVPFGVDAVADPDPHHPLGPGLFVHELGQRLQVTGDLLPELLRGGGRPQWASVEFAGVVHGARAEFHGLVGIFFAEVLHMGDSEIEQDLRVGDQIEDPADALVCPVEIERAVAEKKSLFGLSRLKDPHPQLPVAEDPAVPVDAAAARQVENRPLEFVPELEPRHPVLVDDRGGLKLFRRQFGGQNAGFFRGGLVDTALFRGEEIFRQVPVFAPRRRDDVAVDQTFAPFRIVEVRRVPFVGQGPGNGSRVGGRVQKERFPVLHFDFGPSIKNRGRNVTDLILEGFQTSGKLGIIAAMIAIVLP